MQPDGCDDEGNLLATVPDKEEYAGSVLVFNPDGNSNTLDGFSSPGAGHPIQGTFVGEVPIRSGVRGLGVSGGRVVLPFNGLRNLIPSTGEPMRTLQPVISFVQSADGTTYFSGHGLERDAGLCAWDSATLTRKLTCGPAPVVAQYLSPAPLGATGAAVFAVGQRADGTRAAVAYTAQGSLYTGSVVGLPALTVQGVLAVDGAHVLVAATKLVAGRQASGLIVATPANPATGTGFLEAPAGTALSGAMALATTPTGLRAVVALDDGELATVDPATLSWDQRFPSGSVRAPQAMVVSGADDAGVHLVASFTDEQMLRSVVVGQGPAWTLPMPGRPGAIALEGTKAYVTDESANRVPVVDVEKAALVDLVRRCRPTGAAAPPGPRPAAARWGRARCSSGCSSATGASTWCGRRGRGRGWRSGTPTRSSPARLLCAPTTARPRTRASSARWCSIARWSSATSRRRPSTSPRSPTASTRAPTWGRR